MICLICNTNHNLEICPNCNFIQRKKTLNKEEEKQRYLQHNNSLANQGYVDMLNNFYKKIKPYIKGKSILDFGSGPSPVFSQLIENVDIYDIHFQPKKISKSYDVITMIEVIEHLENPLKILTNLKQHLNPGGIFGVMTLFHTDNVENWWYMTDPTHISFFNKKTIRFLASKLKMRILFIDDKNTFVLGV